MREKRKKRRIRLLKLIVLALIIYLIITVFFSVMGSNIRNIYVVGNSVLSEQEIIDIAGISDYPSFFETPTFTIRNRLLATDIIKDVRVRKGWFNKVTIEVTEFRPLFSKNNQLVLEDGTRIENTFLVSVPILVNRVPDTQLMRLLTEMNKIDKNILRMISEIEYRPNDVDPNRFLLHMNDGNVVYVTLDRFTNIDRYDSILPTLEGRQGILYLDFGGHFEERN